MRHNLRRLLALLLVLTLAAGALPLTVSAAETDWNEAPASEELVPGEEAEPDASTAPDEDASSQIVEPEELPEALPAEETEDQASPDGVSSVEATEETLVVESLMAEEQVTEAAMMDGGDSISYAGAAEVPGGSVTSWTKIRSSSQTLTSGWYAVTEDTVVPNRMTVRGSVNLILCDGCTLTAEKGITVINNNSLTIWGQSQGTGALVAHCSVEYAAGIGGLNGSYGTDANSGDITINGGILDIWGGYGACGIGGGRSSVPNGYCTNITINGGHISAKGDRRADGTRCGYSGAGIGGSGNTYDSYHTTVNSRITINGGVIYAEGTYRSAGIGGAQLQSGAEVTINGGDITAWGGYEKQNGQITAYTSAIGAGTSGYSQGGLTLGIGASVVGGDDEYNTELLDTSGSDIPRHHYMRVYFGDTVQSCFTASFTPGYGNGTMEDMICHSGICVLPESTFTPPEGKKFLNWARGEKTYTPGSVVLLSENACFTAQYRDATPMELLQTGLERGGTVALTEDVYITELDADYLTIPAGINAVLDLNGHTLSFRSADVEDPIFRNGIAVYGNLTVRDTSAAQTGTIQGASGTYAPVIVYSGAALLWEGGTLTRCYGHNTGGVFDGRYIDYIQGRTDTASGSFTMTGGAITGNNSMVEGAGAGVIFCGPIHVSGKVNITDNRTLYSGTRYNEATGSYVSFHVDVPSNLCAEKIIVDAPLDPESRIGVAVPAEAVENGPIALTSGLKGRGVLNNFFADDPSVADLYINSGDGELYACTAGANPPETPTQAPTDAPTEAPSTTPTEAPTDAPTQAIIDLSAATVTAAQQTYTGKAHTPAPTVTLSGTTLTMGTDYDVSYQNNTNAGTAKVIVTGKVGYTGTANGTFTIQKANQTMTVTAPTSVVKGKTVKLTVKNAVGKLTYTTSSKAIATVSAGTVKGVKLGTVTITVKAAGDKNRNPCTKTVKITVTALAAPKVSKVENVSGGVKITVGKVKGAAKYRFFFKKGNGNWTKIGDSASNVFTWKKAANGVQYSFSACCLDKNSKALSDYNRTGKGIVYIAAPTLKNTAARTMKVSWKKAAGVTGYQVQYGVKANFSGAKTVKITKPGTVSTTVKNLTAGKTWYVRIRTYTVKNGKTTYSAWSAASSLKLTK